MIPPGYITLPEALEIIRLCVDDDDKRMKNIPDSADKERWRELAAICALSDGVREEFIADVSVYVMNGGTPTLVPGKHVNELIAEGWERWIRSGWVKAGNRPFDVAVEPMTEEYDGCQLLVRAFDIRYRWKPEARHDPSKSGAPGRPSSMDLVMGEFARRIAGGHTAPSRDAESKELARWLVTKHPNMPKCTAKTILNKLPPAFQPRNGRK